ncbi:hypothetical protein [Longimicrobium sp.]|uniref:hypothetical protein n=1 Tax=Longimicrobium sp. TaxID=2029185 RepID=UPI002C79F80E|nr:hypothetical protein [Longimicrobium sp.]HSU16513.1 hypothetical protein [Longimicrobium sp.]
MRTQSELPKGTLSLPGSKAEAIFVTDEQFQEYFERFIWRFRNVIEEYFPSFGASIPFYASYPYETIIVRAGPAGVLCLFRPAPTPSYTFKDWGEWPEEVLTVEEIKEYFEAPFFQYDFRQREFTRFEGESQGGIAAVTNALSVFWRNIDAAQFARLCRELLGWQKMSIQVESTRGTRDASFILGNVRLWEPGPRLREEKWTFRIQYASTLSVNDIRAVEAEADSYNEASIYCLLTNADTTSIGRLVSLKNPKLRIWDQSFLNRVINGHLDSFSTHFAQYSTAVKALRDEFGYRKSPRLDEMKFELKRCPAGQAYFRAYEELGTRILTYIFSGSLGRPHIQRPTTDGVQRRDVVFQNLQRTPFFVRIGRRFDADFLIVDFKNYAKPLDSTAVESVSKYSNEALGRFVLLISRQGLASGAKKAQARVFRNRRTLVLVIDDTQLLEMVERKDRGEDPADVLSDLLDEFLLQF